MGVNPRGGEESERGALDGRGKGKAGEVGWGDKEDGDRLKEKVAEIRWLISTVGHAGIEEQEVREVLGKAIGRLNILKGQVTVRMGVACRRYRKIPADKTTLGEKVVEWERRCKTVEECFRAAQEGLPLADMGSGSLAWAAKGVLRG